MQDFMKPYSDMSAYYVTIDRTMITELLDAICEKMQYSVIEEQTNFFLLASAEDDRAFLLAVRCIQPFYGISIKCKSSEKRLFFDTIGPFLSKTHEGWGMPHVEYDAHPDWLICDYNGKNPVEDNLQRCGLI